MGRIISMGERDIGWSVYNPVVVKIMLLLFQALLLDATKTANPQNVGFYLTKKSEAFSQFPARWLLVTCESSESRDEKFSQENNFVSVSKLYFCWRVCDRHRP